VKEHEPLYGVVLAFNIKVLPDAEEEATNRNVQIFRENIIYRLVDDYLLWLRTQREAELEQELKELVKPGKIRIMEGYVFRRARPAVVGVEIIAGRIKPKYTLIRGEDGKDVGEIQQIQEKGKALSEAGQGMQVAISIAKPTVGRHIFEKDILYVKVPEHHAKAWLTTFMDRLTAEEQEALNKYVNLMREKIPFWAA